MYWAGVTVPDVLGGAEMVAPQLGLGKCGVNVGWRTCPGMSMRMHVGTCVGGFGVEFFSLDPVLKISSLLYFNSTKNQQSREH